MSAAGPGRRSLGSDFRSAGTLVPSPAWFSSHWRCCAWRCARSCSGFHSAQRLIGALGGSLAITASDGGGTTIAVRLPAAYAAITPCPAEEVQAGLPGWRILDFDERAAFDAALAAAEGSRRRIAALTYDDTTVTRGRLSELVGLMILKPPCRELMRHPLVVRGSEQL